MPRIIEKHNVLMFDALKTDAANAFSLRKNVSGTIGIPGPDNGYRYKSVFFKVPTRSEITIFGSLAALGGVVTGLLAYSRFILPLILR